MMYTFFVRPCCILCVVALVSSSCMASEMTLGVIDTIKVHRLDRGMRMMRASHDGVTISTRDPDDSGRSIIHVYRRDSIVRRRLPLFNVKQAALHDGILYCAVISTDSTSSLAIVEPDNSIRYPATEPGSHAGKPNGTSVTVVGGFVTLNDRAMGMMILKLGDDTLRYSDRNQNAGFIPDERECFFLRDTTYWINQVLRTISFKDGSISTGGAGLCGVNQISIVDDSVRWMDCYGTCHAHSISGYGSTAWNIDTTLTYACVGRAGVLSAPEFSEKFFVYRSFDGPTFSVRTPQFLEQNPMTEYSGIGWYNNAFYCIARTDDTTMMYVLRFLEPEPTSTSIQSAPRKVRVHPSTRCLSRSAARSMFAEMLREEPDTTCFDILGSRVDPLAIITGPICSFSGGSVTFVLVTPD